MTQKRQSIRYQVELDVVVTGALWPNGEAFTAKDVSRGGMFVLTEAVPEPFSEVSLMLLTPAGSELTLEGRVVHVMASAQAEKYGVQPGLGIEFHRLAEAQRVELERLLLWAKDHDESRVVPVRSDERPPDDIDDVARAVWGAVDDESSTDEIAVRLDLAAGEVDAAVRRLADLDLVFVSVAQLEKRAAPRRVRVSNVQAPASSRHVPRAAAPHVTINARTGTTSVAQVAAPRADEPAPTSTTTPNDSSGPATRRATPDRSWRQRTRPGVGPRSPLLSAGAVAPRPQGSGAVAVRPSPRPEPSVDIVQEHLAQAASAFQRGDVDAAKRSLDLLHALDWNRPELTEYYETLRRRVAVAVAERYERQAAREEQAQRWKQAARSWQEVCRGRPEDPECHRRAALALLELREDLRRARDLAQRAVDLSPRDGGARRVLGHVYLEAGLHQNARRELQLAASLSPGDELTQQLLRRVAQAQAARQQG